MLIAWHTGLLSYFFKTLSLLKIVTYIVFYKIGPIYMITVYIFAQKTLLCCKLLSSTFTTITAEALKSREARLTFDAQRVQTKMDWNPIELTCGISENFNL